MPDVQTHEPLHFGNRTDMNVFVVEAPGDRLLHDRGSTFVHGYFTTPELARAFEAISAELRDAQRRAAPGTDIRTLPVWELYLDALHDIHEAREGNGYDTLNSDTLDIDTTWLAENLEVDEQERILPGQVITADMLALSSAANFLPKRKLY